MSKKQIHLDNDELALLGEIESGRRISTPLTNDENRLSKLRQIHEVLARK